MARARNIKPSFFSNEELAEQSFEARILFIGLWTLADREGRLEDRPKKIKMALFPADNVDIDSCLTALAECKLIVRYEIDGIKCISIPKFTVHQKPHSTEKDSELPDENSYYTVHERNKVGAITGKSHQIRKGETVNQQLDNSYLTVNGALDNSSTTVNKHNHNALNVECGILNPDLLNPECGMRNEERPPSGESSIPSKTGAVCVALKSEGIGSVSPSSPKLKALLDAGAEIGMFVDAARAAKERGKAGFNYVLAIVGGQMQDAAAAALKVTSATKPNRQEALEARNQAVADRVLASGVLQ